MSICSVCRKLLHGGPAIEYPGYNYSSFTLCNDEVESNSVPGYFTSLDALKRSSSDCALCKAVVCNLEELNSDLDLHLIAEDSQIRALRHYYEPSIHGKEPALQILVEREGSYFWGRRWTSLGRLWTRQVTPKTLSERISTNSGGYNSALGDLSLQNCFLLNAVDFVDSSMRECVEMHEHCPAKDIGPLPSRLLELSDDTDQIRVIDTKGSHGRYAALSYCWGNEHNITLTKDSATVLKSGFPIASLPRCHLEAVLWTRHLGLQHLWIDALCIIQDDPLDWAEEAGKMAAVYSNAFVTLAATSSAAPSEGLGTKLRPWQMITCNHESLPNTAIVVQVLPSEVSDSPLNRRGWTLQEAHLSSRIVMFTGSEVKFQCLRGLMYSQSSVRSAPRTVRRHRAANDHDYHLEWLYLVNSYTRRLLSKYSDTLPALSGLAKHFSQHINADYVAGFWSDRLLQGLRWFTLYLGSKFDGANLEDKRGDRIGPLRHEYVAPSWSWASSRAPVCFNTRSSTTHLASIVEYDVNFKANQPGQLTSEFGQITSASLTVTAPFALITFRYILNANDREWYGPRISQILNTSGKAIKNLWFDKICCSYEYLVCPDCPASATSVGEWRSIFETRGLCIILLTSRPSWDDETKVDFDALILAPLENGDYERRGYIDMWHVSERQQKVWRKLETKTITLV